MTSEFGRGCRVLVIDDDPSVRLVLQTLLEDDGFVVTLADCVAAGTSAWDRSTFELVITDKNLGDGSGLDVVRHIYAQKLPCPIIVMSAFASLDSAVEAIRMRVADYLVKPFDDIDVVLERVQRVVRYHRLQAENQRLLEEVQDKNRRLQELVVRDGLTGLFNHAYFQECFDKEFERSSRHGHEFALLFVDVDHFKEINDQLGHQTGDRVLQTIAIVLRGDGRLSDDAFRLRDSDIAARYGGDEFVLVLPETSKAGAALKATRLRKHVAALTIEGVPHAPTLSIGVAAYPADGHNRADLIHAADTALYAAKQLGRDQVVSFTEDLETQTSLIASLPRMSGSRASDGGFDLTFKEAQLICRYAPIVSLNGASAGAGIDSPSRPRVARVHCDRADGSDPGLETLTMLAERSGRVPELGRAIRRLSLPLLLHPEFHGMQLFLPTHPFELNGDELWSSAALFEVARQRIVLELPAAMAQRNPKWLASVQKRGHDAGFALALSGVKPSYSMLHALGQTRPDYVMFDATDPAFADAASALQLRHLVEFALSQAIKVVVLGAADASQQLRYRELGCTLFEGAAVASEGLFA